MTDVGLPKATSTSCDMVLWGKTTEFRQLYFDSIITSLLLNLS